MAPLDGGAVVRMAYAAETDLAVFKAKHPKAKPRQCVVCGVYFIQVTGGARRCCSRDCGWTYMRSSGHFDRMKQNNIEKRLATNPNDTLEYWLLDALNAIRRYEFTKIQQRAKPKRLKPCDFCGSNRRGECRLACELLKRVRIRLRIREQKRANGKCHAVSHAQRARANGASVVRFSRLAIFKRDEWHCKQCGCATPQTLLKDFTHKQAPTLDHIIPIELGGSHSPGNCQLLCRSCNSKKGASVLNERKAKSNRGNNLRGRGQMSMSFGK